MKELKAKIACLEARLKKEENNAEVIRDLLSRVRQRVNLTFNRVTSNKTDKIRTLFGEYVWRGSETSCARVSLQYIPNNQSITLSVGRSKLTSRPYCDRSIDERKGTGGYSKRMPLEDMACLFDSLRKYHIKPSEVIARIKRYGENQK